MVCVLNKGNRRPTKRYLTNIRGKKAGSNQRHVRNVIGAAGKGNKGLGLMPVEGHQVKVNEGTVMVALFQYSAVMGFIGSMYRVFMVGKLVNKVHRRTPEQQ